MSVGGLVAWGNLTFPGRKCQWVEKRHKAPESVVVQSLPSLYGRRARPGRNNGKSKAKNQRQVYSKTGAYSMTNRSHFPLKFAARFSRNAVIPSFMSSVEANSPKRDDSKRIATSAGESIAR